MKRLKFCKATLIGIMIAVALSACSGGNNNAKTKAGALKDTLIVWADTGMQVIANEQKEVFEHNYNQIAIEIRYMQEDDIIKGLLNNIVNTAFLQRPLTEREYSYISESEKFKPMQYTFGYSAMVLLASEQYSSDYISEEQLGNYFKGKGPAGLSLIFENSKSQAISFFLQHYKLSPEEMKRAYAKAHLNDLLTQLRNDPNAVGVIPFTYIAEADIPATKTLLQGLKILEVEYSDSTGKILREAPSQETIATKAYPFINPLLFVNCNMDKKSGNTFINYMFTERGQRLMLKCGIVPAIFPGREIKITTN